MIIRQQVFHINLILQHFIETDFHLGASKLLIFSAYLRTFNKYPILDITLDFSSTLPNSVFKLIFTPSTKLTSHKISWIHITIVFGQRTFISFK